MIKATKLSLAVFALLILLTSAISAEEKLGLVIIAHGAPSPVWNQPVLDIEEEVRGIMQAQHPDLFSSIRVALMEFVEPSIATVIADMENDGIGKIYAIPLFIAPSSHNLYDIPTILGLYSDKEMVAQMEEEGIKIVDTDMKITIGPTLDAEVIKAIMIDRVKDMSARPDSEAIVILAHGDRDFQPLWVSLVREVGSGLCAKLGINYFNYGFVGMGQGFISEGAPAVFRTLDKYNRILVVGLYISSSIERIAQRSIARIAGEHISSADLFAGQHVSFANRGLLPDKRISEWVVRKASEWAEGLETER